MGERTAEGHNPNTALEPNPAGKPNPEDIDPQLTAMLIDRLREGIHFPAEVRTIDALVEWTHCALNEATKRETALAVAERRSSQAAPYLMGPQDLDEQDVVLEEAPLRNRPTLSKNTLLGGFVENLIAKTNLDAPSAFDILGVCMELAVFLIDKNAAYGDSALDPVRIMSVADPSEQIRVRMDDKLSRLMRGQAGGEDALKDLVGYWVLMRVAEKRLAARG